MCRAQGFWMIWFHLVFLVAFPSSLWPSEASAWQVERVVQTQVNTQVRASWPGAPIAFGRSGINVIVTSPRAVDSACGDDADGCHGVTPAGQPFIYVANNGGDESWSVPLSHEIIETSVDPQADGTLDGLGLEICDPVENLYYTLRGIMVSDFVRTEWFTGARGPYDQMREAPRALHPYYGSMPD